MTIENRCFIGKAFVVLSVSVSLLSSLVLADDHYPKTLAEAIKAIARSDHGFRRLSASNEECVKSSGAHGSAGLCPGNSGGRACFDEIVRSFENGKPLSIDDVKSGRGLLCLEYTARESAYSHVGERQDSGKIAFTVSGKSMTVTLFDNPAVGERSPEVQFVKGNAVADISKGEARGERRMFFRVGSLDGARGPVLLFESAVSPPRALARTISDPSSDSSPESYGYCIGF